MNIKFCLAGMVFVWKHRRSFDVQIAIATDCLTSIVELYFYFITCFVHFH